MIELPAKYTDFSDLDQFHQYMDAIFVSHQIAIMEGKSQEALTILTMLQKRMSRHIRDEEALLLPPYQLAIKPEPQGGAVAFFQKEHLQILGFLHSLIGSQPSGQAHISFVRYFDQCIIYKDLLDHHQARERHFLYRLLDGVLQRKEKKRILERFGDNQKNVG